MIDDRLTGGNVRSQEAELAQLATQRLRHILGTRRGAVEVAWGVFGREIAPALERPPRPRLDQDELRLEHQMAAADPLLVDEWPHIDEPLPAHDFAADHPVERAAVAQFIGALGHHARPVHVLGREPALPALLELLADPILEFFDRVTADAKLDEMQGHGGYCRTECDEIIARRACLAMRAQSLSSEDRRTYCAGATGTGAERAGAALEGGRGGEPACGGLRGGVGVAASAAPVASWGCRCAGGGSAVMILTGGIEVADGKERVFGTFAAALGAGGGGGVAPPPPPPARPPAAQSLRPASHRPS